MKEDEKVPKRRVERGAPPGHSRIGILYCRHKSCVKVTPVSKRKITLKDCFGHGHSFCDFLVMKDESGNIYKGFY